VFQVDELQTIDIPKSPLPINAKWHGRFYHGMSLYYNDKFAIFTRYDYLSAILNA